ncbi:ADP-ribosylglycohydrolase family protein [Candidatus Woesearchaeota archaeon]|nr:ADP-ribosylglycohydrolase family protein [Candidatus Woesearchaeota archaeon]
MNLEERFLGCLIGLAVGDALGGPIEEIPGKPKPTAKRPLTEMIGGGPFNLKPGEYTDDASMALALAKTIITCKGYHPIHVAREYAKWERTLPSATGRTIQESMRRIRAGIPWDKASDNPYGNNYAGTGAAMRCAPIALLNHSRPEKLIEHTRKDAIITHRHPDCISSSIFINTFIAALLRADDPLIAKNYALRHINDNPALQKRYETLEHAGKPTKGVYDIVENSVHTLLTTTTFEEALTKSVNLAGDADTRGAVTGAIAGAHYGEKAIPLRWKQALVDHLGTPAYERIKRLAHDLYRTANT